NHKQAQIPLCTAAAVALRAETAEYCNASGLVFAAMPCGTVFRSDLLRAQIPYRDDRGRPLSFHGLRKYFATALIAQGIDLPVVQQLMRHSDIRLTLRCYNDVLDSRLGEAVDRLPEIAPGRE
ncbi:MAG: tyrosine-type recombinase/integrase, partial [Planctomycetes bacterium]|nr:tyrosine-type recombinase/integrase [Planctomycetota bacterium]